MVMPAQKPGRSVQDYATPPEFLVAVKKRLGIREFAYDLAADHSNAAAAKFFTAENNALLHEWWVIRGWSWLNPPFAALGPWVKKANLESLQGAYIAMLVPASVGANWWAEWVHRRAYVLFLNGRLTFVGETAPYPKDCALLLFTPDGAPGYDVWRWASVDNS